MKKKVYSPTLIIFQCPEAVPISYVQVHPRLVCLLERDSGYALAMLMEVPSRRNWSWRPISVPTISVVWRELVLFLVCLTRELALTNKPALDCKVGRWPCDCGFMVIDF